MRNPRLFFVEKLLKCYMGIKYTIYSIIKQYKCTIYCIEKNPLFSDNSSKVIFCCFFIDFHFDKSIMMSSVVQTVVL